MNDEAMLQSLRNFKSPNTAAMEDEARQQVLRRKQVESMMDDLGRDCYEYRAMPLAKGKGVVDDTLFGDMYYKSYETEENAWAKLGELPHGGCVWRLPKAPGIPAEVSFGHGWFPTMREALEDHHKRTSRSGDSQPPC